jgi:hypothetical protein
MEDAAARTKAAIIARASLEFVVNNFGSEARYICRTVCGMITWAAILLLQVGL